MAALHLWYKMVNMKKLILITLLFTGLGMAGFAQAKASKVHKSPEEKAKFKTEAMARDLKLSASQKDAVYKINLEAARERASYKSDKKAMDENSRKAFKDRNKAHEDKILGVLNAEQKDAFTKMKQDHNKRKGHHRDK